MKIFVEEQKFTQPWIMILLVVFLIIVPLIAVLSIETNPDSNEKTIIIGSIVFMNVLIFGLMLSVKLITRIDELGIHYRFYPFHLKPKMISWQDISSCHTRKYNAVKEYGGWGIKPGLGKKKGKSFTVKGNRGLQIELKNGRKILIGTQKTNEIERTLNNYKYKIEGDEIN